MNRRSSSGNGREVTLDSKAGQLTGKENCCIITLLTIVILTVMVLTSFAPDMLIYDEGDVYSCPSDYLQNELSKKVQENEGKAYQIDPISHNQFEDMFYDPMACRPFYQDIEVPIWYGRVENIKKAN